MNDREELFSYRRNQAMETLHEAEKMLEDSYSARSIINRSYYAMFYMVLALFLKTDTHVKTSKHTGIMSIFDKDFVRTGKFNRNLSRALHKAFDRRLEFDYKELLTPSNEDAKESVSSAQTFIQEVDKYCDVFSETDNENTWTI